MMSFSDFIFAAFRVAHVLFQFLFVAAARIITRARARWIKKEKNSTVGD